MNREEYFKTRIFSILASIEKITGLLAHEIPELKENLALWQDGKIKDSFFNIQVMEYFDNLNMD